MPKKRKWIILGIIIASLFLFGCCVTLGYVFWNSPLGEPLEIVTEQKPSSGEDILNQEVDVFPSPHPIQTQANVQMATNCGESGSMNILVLGIAPSDFPGPNGPLDVRIIQIDFSRKKTTVFYFPRDLWIPVVGLESLGFAQTRLGEVYLIARSNGGYSVSAATITVAQNLYSNFNATSHHYITASMSTLADIIDVVGGIDITIPTSYDGTPYGFHYFPAGLQHMNGQLAMEYAIAPSPTHQWTALDRKNLVLIALFQKIFSPAVVPNIPALISQFQQIISTDLSPQQIVNLICISQEIPQSEITVTGVGPTDVAMGASGVLYPNFDAIREKVRLFIAV
ncbi:MAG: LCP family protein [Anaerolineales bacterium]|nr:LCP family protein [Anaerolineales bacterium]